MVRQECLTYWGRGSSGERRVHHALARSALGNYYPSSQFFGPWESLARSPFFSC